MEEISNQTLHEILKRVEDKVDGVSLKADKTNGNVKDLQLWKARMVGAWAVLSIIVTGILIPLTLNYLNQDEKTERAIENVMSNYFIEE